MRLRRLPLAFALVWLTVAAGCHARGDAEPKRDEDEGASAAKSPPKSAPAGVVELTPEQLASTKIVIAKAQRRQDTTLLSAAAQIEPFADGVARVGPRVAGRITALKAGPGDLVRSGQVLAIVDAPDLGRARADFDAAVATAKVTRETADREKALFEKHISSERDWRQAEAEAVRAQSEQKAAANRLRTLGLSDRELAGNQGNPAYGSTTAITSPLGGVIVERSATLGEMVEPKDTLFVVMDTRQVWILVDVYEQNLAQVKRGQTVTATVSAYQGKVFSGIVDNIGAVVDAHSRAVKVRVVVPNPEGELKPGMFANVVLSGTNGPPREHLVVPAAAVQRDGKEFIVFVPLRERQFERREVQLGPSSGDWTEVQDGLADGESVVTNGSFILKSELKKGALPADDD